MPTQSHASKQRPIALPSSAPGKTFLESSRAAPLIRWAGSKKRSLPQIVPFLRQDFNRYFEVFSGSAALFFSIEPALATLCDNNIDLMMFYRAAKRSPDAVYEEFIRLPRNEVTYYRIRGMYHDQEHGLQKAAWFLYMNRNCFNGIYRTNVEGRFNVPFSSSRVPKYQTWEEFRSSVRLLRRAQLKSYDFQTVCCENVKKGDFVYLDPPYYIPNKRVFREYSPNPFSEIDLDRLADTLRAIHKSRAYFLLSYPDCERIRRLSYAWHTRTISVRRTIAGSPAARGGVAELIITNYETCHV